MAMKLLFLNIQCVIFFATGIHSQILPSLPSLPGFKFPISKDPNDIGFYLFTNSSNPDAWTELPNPGDPNIRHHDNRPWIFLIHGFNYNLSPLDPEYGVASLKDEYLRNSTYNIVIVDWRNLSTSEPKLTEAIGTAILYPFGQSIVPVVGEKIAKFIMEMHNANIIRDYRDVHLIGHSLGSHVAGTVGLYIKEATNGNQLIGRITGLDPAKIVFNALSKKYRLSPDKALFVDAIHSAITSAGTMLPVAHVDYYPNGGHTLRQSYTKNDCEKGRVVCGHFSAIFYFENVLNGQKYLSCPCGNQFTEIIPNQFPPCTEPKLPCNGPNIGDVVPPVFHGQYYTFISPPSNPNPVAVIGETINRSFSLIRSAIGDIVGGGTQKS